VKRTEFNCGLGAALEVVGGKWKVLILWPLQSAPRRFGDLRRQIPGISEKMLIQHLKEMEADGIVTRTDYKEVPPRVDYALTAFGHSLCDALAPLYRSWKDLLEMQNAKTLSEEERLQKIDIVRFQLDEIEKAKLKAGEEEELTRRLPELKNGEKLQSFAQIAYGMPDVLGAERARYAGKTVAVLGAGHSAVGTLIDLARLKDEAPATEIIWLLLGDKPEKAFGGGANDKLAARGALGAAFAALVASGKVRVEAGFKVSHLRQLDERLKVATGAASCCRSVTVDKLVVATGFRPELDFLREVRLSLDPAVECPPTLAPLIDPNLHSCGTVRPHGARELAQPEPGFYFAGIKSYGRAPTFLMLTGYEQVRSIVAEIAGDHDAAAKVELVLPETGVCSGPGPTLNEASAEAGCCGGPPVEAASGCCVADVKAQEEGKKGCGCG